MQSEDPGELEFSMQMCLFKLDAGAAQRTTRPQHNKCRCAVSPSAAHEARSSFLVGPGVRGICEDCTAQRAGAGFIAARRDHPNGLRTKDEERENLMEMGMLRKAYFSARWSNICIWVEDENELQRGTSYGGESEPGIPSSGADVGEFFTNIEIDSRGLLLLGTLRGTSQSP
ncbi:hypothetical protein B0H17DRAFT_1282777 [Mycena rosella]|uniref:Uncharacterized protein n=1 Tax=Mycena rosella TaxID=1033263 RepID=A0AAD7DIX5_MYCRO|nr:hypothetical protein B0H17DRAFT_1282777 [Mycena rosella]